MNCHKKEKKSGPRPTGKILTKGGILCEKESFSSNAKDSLR